jgi:hypothetical protein
MKTIPTQYIQRIKTLSLQLLDWHGGMSSGLYSVGSTMLSAANRKEDFDRKSMQDQIKRAIYELRNLKRDANFPDCVTSKDERELAKLANKLEAFLE